MSEAILACGESWPFNFVVKSERRQRFRSLRRKTALLPIDAVSRTASRTLHIQISTTLWLLALDRYVGSVIKLSRTGQTYKHGELWEAIGTYRHIDKVCIILPVDLWQCLNPIRRTSHRQWKDRCTEVHEATKDACCCRVSRERCKLTTSTL